MADPASERRSYVRAGAVVAVLLAVLFVILLVATRNQQNPQVQPAPSASATAEPVGPKIVSADELAGIPGQVGHPVYWAGPDSTKDLELTVLADSSVYVRYLPNGTPAGADQPALTVATYSRPDAYSLVQAGADRPDAVSANDSGGALVTAESPQSTNAYFAFQNVPVLIEVFDPKPGRAYARIQDGQIQMIQ